MKKQTIILMVGILGLLVGGLFVSAQQGSVEDLISSYSFDYFGPEIDVEGVNDYMSDEDSNGQNDTLYFNVSVHNATSGDYKFYIDVEVEGTKVIGSATHNIASVPASRLINVSTELISGDMFNYTLRVYDSSGSLVYRESGFETQQYGPYEEGYSVITIDDANIGNDLIRVDLDINSSKSLTEDVSVFMKHNDDFISSTKSVSLSTGSNDIEIDFDNETIKSTHYNGTYLIERVQVGDKIIRVNHTTDSYDYETFAKTSYIRSYDDSFIDTNSNNLSEVLQIATILNIKQSGSYTVENYVYGLDGRHLSTISDTQTLGTGEQTVYMNISGPDIYSSQIDGPYEIIYSKLISGNETIDSRQNAFLTNISSYRDFERPPLPDLDISLNVHYNGTDNLVNVTVSNEGNATAFNVFVDLLDANSSYRGEDSVAVLNASDSALFEFVANGTAENSTFVGVVDFNNLVDESDEVNNVASNLEFITPEIDVTELNVVYQNSTERIFMFAVNNTLNVTINQIEWLFDTGDDNYSSEVNASLASGEEYYVYLYHNYSSSGNYSVTATAQNTEYSDMETIETVI